MKKNELANLWFAKGKEDLLYARAVVNEIKIYGLLCFHCQQAVEKFLKSYLTEIGVRFRKTHKLTELLSLCLKADKRFIIFKQEMINLDQYYIETRYPLDNPRLYTKQEAREAIVVAEKVLKFIKSL